MKVALGVLIALAIGAVCRWFNIPVPAPPTFVGALLVVAITAGYIGADRLLARRSSNPQARQSEKAVEPPADAAQGPQSLRKAPTSEPQRE